MTTTADFWFDPLCPYAWMTSRWLVEVQAQRAIEVTWRPMSLAILNEGKQVAPEWQDFMLKAWGPVRVVTAVAEREGDDFVLPLFTAMGEHIHLGGEADLDEVCRKALVEVGLPESLADVAASTEFDAALAASHAEAMALAGDDVGTPILGLDGPDGDRVGFMGPIVSPAPRGEAALRLWDAVVIAAATPGFFELKRTRTAGPDFG